MEKEGGLSRLFISPFCLAFSFTWNLLRGLGVSVPGLLPETGFKSGVIIEPESRESKSLVSRN